jgi:hypothetical protein
MSTGGLSDRVNRDPKLSGDEKETTITMYGQDKHIHIFSAKPTVMKSLLKHDYFELESARVVKNGKSKTVGSRDELETVDGDIVAVEGEMPVGVLTVKSKPRVNNHQSNIVNSETIDSSVFE